MKKKLLTTLAVLTTLTFLTACGSSDKKEASQPNNEEEPTSMIVVKPDSELSDELEEDLYNPEEICALYYDYIYGLIPEAEYLETLEAVFETNPDDAKAIFEEHGEEYGYKFYEMSEEIKNSKVGDQIIQIGDAVVTFPCTVGELVESTSAELVSTGDVKKMYRTFEEIWLATCYESLDTFGDNYGHILLKTSDGTVLYCETMGDGELHRASDLYISRIITGSNNVFLAGGIHTGLSMEETDAIFESNLGDGMSHGKWVGKSSSENRNMFLLISASINPDRDWDQYPSSGLTDEITVLKIDTEGTSLYHLEARFSTPYDE